jgi:hypothetical protein
MSPFTFHNSARHVRPRVCRFSLSRCSSAHTHIRHKHNHTNRTTVSILTLHSTAMKFITAVLLAMPAVTAAFAPATSKPSFVSTPLNMFAKDYILDFNNNQPAKSHEEDLELCRQLFRLIGEMNEPPYVEETDEELDITGYEHLDYFVEANKEARAYRDEWRKKNKSTAAAV